MTSPISCSRNLLGTAVKHLLALSRPCGIQSRTIANVKMELTLLEKVKCIVPKLSKDRHKGAAGRVGVIGGSLEYTGAPYFASISALKVGCDLAHVFCQEAAAPVIKSYSPELIVHPLLDRSAATSLIVPWLDRLHVLIIGPGLGRDAAVFSTVTSIISYCKEQTLLMPLIIDADGLFLLSECPNIIKDYPGQIVLTPNAMEFSRLAKSVLNENWVATPEPEVGNVSKLAAAFGPNVVVVHKGYQDVIATGEASFICSSAGSGRRCGGQGDLLCGSLGTFFAWAISASKDNNDDIVPGVVASYAACRLTRECNFRAFRKNGRSTVTSDMIQEIHHVFEELFELCD